MPSVTMLDPCLQHDGTSRYLTLLKAGLASNKFASIRLASAYAKASGVARIYSEVNAFRGNGRSSSLIVGIDQKGTSYQALRLALQSFQEVFICHTGGGGTFHPKFCLLKGPADGQLLIGSHNLTCGGLETNLEAGVLLEYGLPHEAAEFKLAEAMWTNLISASFTKKLDTPMLNQLYAAGSLLDESVKGARKFNVGSAAKTPGGAALFPRISVTAPTPLPHHVLALAIPLPSAPAGPAASPPKAAPLLALPSGTPLASTAAARSLAIQLRPHDNGEIFLSMRAVRQNPAFFDFPFTGKTTPKKIGADAYPQRVPDPKVDITVYSSTGAALVSSAGYELNTVYYERKKELRITVTGSIRSHIKELALLHMQESSGGADYIMEIYNPGSAAYSKLLASCDQTMPGGGSAPRKFGWL